MNNKFLPISVFLLTFSLSVYGKDPKHVSHTERMTIEHLNELDSLAREYSLDLKINRKAILANFDEVRRLENQLLIEDLHKRQQEKMDRDRKSTQEREAEIKQVSAPSVNKSTNSKDKSEPSTEDKLDALKIKNLKQLVFLEKLSNSAREILRNIPATQPTDDSSLYTQNTPPIRLGHPAHTIGTPHAPVPGSQTIPTDKSGDGGVTSKSYPIPGPTKPLSQTQ